MRPDGTRIKIEDPMYLLLPYVLEKRYDSMNMLTVDIPLEPMKEYLNRKRQEGTSISHMALFLAAYLRCVREFPKLNRFVVSGRVYQRNEFSVGLVVLRPGSTNNTMSKIYLDFDDTVYDVQKKVLYYVEENQKAEADNATDRLMNSLMRLPSFILAGAVRTLKWMDRHNLLPKGIVDASPFHTSLSISNLASIRTNHIYHHTYEFGTTGMFITMGNNRIVRMKKKGVFEDVVCMPLGIVMDERIASGHYAATAFTRIRSYLANPSPLEEKPGDLPIASDDL